MTVKELRKHLASFPDDLPVCYRLYSEYKLLTVDSLDVQQLQPARQDGWVHDNWPGKPRCKRIRYLVFPGN